MNYSKKTGVRPSFPGSAWMLASGMLLLLPLLAEGQSLDHLKPAPVPRQVEMPSRAVTLPGSGATDSIKPALPAAGEVLVNALKGVAFFASPESAATAKVGTGLSFSGVTQLDTPNFRAAMDVFLKRPLTRELMRQLTTATELYLDQRGYPFTVVFFPPQDITAGTVRVVVLLSHLESDVAVEGAKYFSPELYKEQIHIDPGAPLNAQSLREDVAWINRNPFRAATIEARPGKKPGTTQLVLKVREVRPVRFFVGADNYGTKLTQYGREHIGFNLGNAFGLGHQASMQVSTSEDHKTFLSAAGSYTIDLLSRNILSFSGAYSRTKGKVPYPFSLDGKSWQVAADYTVPLKSVRDGLSQQLTFGVDLKSSTNNFNFATIPLSNTLTRVAQARVGYAESLQSDTGTTTFGATLTASPGCLIDHDSDQYYALSRTGAKARYAYLKANASHRLPLDKLKEGLAWYVRGQAQVASTNLLGSEQFEGGGVNSIRGYEQGELYTDNGVLLSQELHLPPLLLPTHDGGTAGRVDAFLFEDYARLWNTHPLAAESVAKLHSVGLGVNLAFGRKATLQASYGVQLRDSGNSQTGANSRLNMALNVSF